MEKGNGNGERERGTGTGNGNREQGTGNREQGTENREQRTENRERPKSGVIPSGAAQRRSRGIAVVPSEGLVPLPVGSRFLDSAPSALRSE
jgi:hypothetical protein